MLTLFAVALLAACGGDVEAFLTPADADKSHHTRIIAIHDRGGVDAMVVSLDDDPDRPATFSRALDDAERAQVYVLDYRLTLDEIGLSRGRLGPGNAGTRACRLGAPESVQRAEIDRAGVVTSWITIAPRDVRVAVFDHLLHSADTCAVVDRCRTMTSRNLTLDDAFGSVEVMFRLNNETGLVGTKNGRFFVVSRDDASPQPDMDNLPSWSGTIMSTGTIWLGGRGGLVATGPNRRELVVSKAGDDGEIITALLPLENGEVFAVATTQPTTRSRLLHFDKTTWNELATRTLITEVSPSHGGLLRMPNGRIVAIDGSPSLWLVEPDLRVRETAGPGSVHASIGYHPTLGVVVGTNLGRAFSATEPLVGDWENVGNTLAQTVEAIGVKDDVLYYGSANGRLGQYYPGAALCEIAALQAIDLNFIVPIGDRLLIGGGSVDPARANVVGWVEFGP